MKRLIENFMQTDKVYTQMLILTEDKKNMIIKMELDDLNKTIKQEQLLIVDANKLEQQRIKLIGELFPEKSADTKVAFKDVLAMADPKAAAQLQEIYDRLIKTVKKLEIQNQQNKLILTKALDIVNFQINIFSGATVDPIYGSAQGENQNIINRKIFDKTV